MDALIAYSQTQQLMNSLQSTGTAKSNEMTAPLLSFQPTAPPPPPQPQQSADLNNYLMSNSYSQLNSLHSLPESLQQQNKINEFFKMLSTQQPTTSSSLLVSPNTFSTNPAAVSNPINLREQTTDNFDDPNLYNVAAAYNAVSASLVGKLASKKFAKFY